MLTALLYTPVEPTKHDPTETEYDVQRDPTRPQTRQCIWPIPRAMTTPSERSSTLPGAAAHDVRGRPRRPIRHTTLGPTAATRAIRCVGSAADCSPVADPAPPTGPSP